jgi:hypothetical protein
MHRIARCTVPLLFLCAQPPSTVASRSLASTARWCVESSIVVLIGTSEHGCMDSVELGADPPDLLLQG